MLTSAVMTAISPILQKQLKQEKGEVTSLRAPNSSGQDKVKGSLQTAGERTACGAQIRGDCPRASAFLWASRGWGEAHSSLPLTSWPTSPGAPVPSDHSKPGAGPAEHFTRLTHSICRRPWSGGGHSYTAPPFLRAGNGGSLGCELLLALVPFPSPSRPEAATGISQALS